MRTALMSCALLMMIGCACAQPKYMGVSAERAFANHAPPAPTPDKTPPPTVDAQAPPVELAKVGKAAPAGAQEVRKIIYQGQFAVVVSDVQQAQDRLKSMAAEMGGYLQSLSAQEVVIRVPSGKFDEASSAVARLGTITQREIKAQDVTEDVTDLETRLRNSRALKEKVLALLERAGTLQAALELEKEAARVTLDIERLEGALARIANQVTFGTLSVSLQPSSNYTPPAINPQLPFDWLRGVGLEKLMQFKGKNLY